MLLDAGLIVEAVGIALGVGVLVDGRHIAVLLEGIDIGRGGHIERGLLDGRLALDVEVSLAVGDGGDGSAVDDRAEGHLVALMI